MQVLYPGRIGIGKLVFVEGGKSKNLEETLGAKARINDKHNPHMVPSWNQPQVTLMGGDRSHHCAIPASLA